MCNIPNPAQPVKTRKPSKSAVTRVDCDRSVKGTGALWFVTIWQGKKMSHYWLLPLVSDHGVAYQFECSRTTPAGEMQLEAYDVLVANEQDCRCDCAGFEHHGRCKHLTALKILMERGELARPELHDDACVCDACVRLREYKPAGHDHGIAF